MSRAASRNIGISKIYLYIYIYLYIFWELQIEPCSKLINQSTLGKQVLRETNTKSHKHKCEFLMAPNTKNGDFLSFVIWESIKKSSSIQCRPAKIPDSATSSFFWLAVCHTVGGPKISNPCPTGCLFFNNLGQSHLQRHFVRLIKYCKKTIAKIRVGINGLWARRQGHERNVGTWKLKNFHL